MDETSIAHKSKVKIHKIPKENIAKIIGNIAVFVYIFLAIFQICFKLQIKIVCEAMQACEIVILGLFGVTGSILMIYMKKLYFSKRKLSIFVLFGSINFSFVIINLFEKSLMDREILLGILNLSRIIMIISLFSEENPLIVYKEKLLSVINNLMESESIKMDEKSYYELSLLSTELKSSALSHNFPQALQIKALLPEDSFIKVPSIVINYSDIPNIDNLDFDIFSLNAKSCNNELVSIMIYLFNRYNFVQEDFPITEFTNFVCKIQEGYLKNPYHNATHASDVVQFLHYLLFSCDIAYILNCPTNLKALIFISGAIHDYKHPGLTNQFLIKTQNSLAKTYNDKSVLENFHVCSAFDIILSSEKFNLFNKIDQGKYQKYRKIIIELVLATDFERHDSDYTEIVNIVSKDHLKENEKLKVYQTLVHVSDISNPGRPWLLSQKWVELLFEEYFSQGDIERKLEINVSPMCDRHDCKVPQTQIFFIGRFVLPMLESLGKIAPKLTICKETAEFNVKKWKALIK